MSINSIGVNWSTVDESGHGRRAAMIATLPPFVPTETGKGHPNVGHTAVQLNYRRLPDIHDDHIDVTTLEFPDIEVSIELFGKRFSQTLSRGDDSSLPMISVYDINIRDS